MPEPDVFPEPVALLPDAENRLLRTVDAVPAGAWSAPSLLPGWTRAHVVAHLALNAEALTGVLRGVVADEAVPMYRSPEARDADIETLAATTVEEGPTELRERLMAGSTAFADALAAVPPDRAATTFERTPGGRRSEAWQVVGMRLREVEVHHVDLGLVRTHGDWPLAFAVHLVDTMTARAGAGGPFRVHATDAGRTWDVGGVAGPLVSGTAADLGWWLTGRGTGEGLTSDDGRLPGIEGL